VKSKDLIKELEAAGWVLVRIKGSHHQFKHPNQKLPLTVPHPKKDLKVGLVKAIRKQAGL
jgi:predicted RNA binding protein YcfA (HicA-like mRNA interferase family)